MIDQHIQLLDRYFTSGRVQPAEQPQLTEALKWAAGQRNGVRLSDGRLRYIDWKGDPALRELLGQFQNRK